jgi:polysaccharide pyruvyl transferase CsaB
MAHAVALGCYGARNVGDELLLDRVRTWLAELGLDTIFVTTDPHYSSVIHPGCGCVSRYDFPELVRSMQGAQLFVLGGGGVFQEHHRLAVDDLYRYPAGSISEYAQICLIARQLGLPQVLLGQGVGPLQSSRAKEIVSDIFQQAQFVSVRDPPSAELLRTLGVRGPVRIAPDPVWSCSIERLPRPPVSAATLAVVLRHWPFEPYWPAKAAAALKLATEQAWTLRFINYGGELDAAVIAEVVAGLCPDAYSVVDAYEQPLAAPEHFAGCAAVLAMRLHAAILAAKCGLPLATLEYDAKVSLVAEELRLPHTARIPIAASQQAYSAAIAALCAQDLGRAFPPNPDTVDAFASEALLHREVLAEAVESTSNRAGPHPWTAGEFDWIGLWAAQAERAFRLNLSEKAAALAKANGATRRLQVSLDIALREKRELDQLRERAVEKHESAQSEARQTRVELDALRAQFEEERRQHQALVAENRARSEETARVRAESTHLRQQATHLEDARRRAERHLEALQAETIQRQAALHAASRRLSRVGSRLHRLQTQRRAWRMVHADLRLQLQSLHREKSSLEHERRTHALHSADLSSAITRLHHAHAAALDEAWAETEAVRARLSQMLSSAHTELADLKRAHVRELAQVDRRRNDWEYLARAMEASTSWRVTRPLRAVSLMLRRAHRRAAYLREIACTDGATGALRWLYRRSRHGRRAMLPPVSATDGTPTGSDLRALREAIDVARAAGREVFVLLPAINWNVPLFQRPQHMALALSRANSFVVYLTFEHLGAECCEIAPNVWLVACRFAESNFGAQMDSALLETFRGCIVTAYSTSWLCSIRQLDEIRQRNVLVYEYIDHIDETISGDKTPVLAEIKRHCLAGGADLVVASARQLFDEAVGRVGADRVAFVPNGVDLAHYDRARRSPSPVPADYLSFKNRHRALVGYFGALAPWLWYDLLNSVTERRPDLGFVFIGPDYFGARSQLINRANVLWTGPVPYANLESYARHFDVCTIPFQLGEVARTTSPLKLFEYFALEKPVIVTSDLRECTLFPEVFAAADPDQFSARLDEALSARGSSAYRMKLRKIAEQNTWDRRAMTLLDACKLDPRHCDMMRAEADRALRRVPASSTG